MSMSPSPWAPRPGYQRASGLPQTSSDPSPLPGTGQRYQVHRETAPFAPAGRTVSSRLRPGPTPAHTPSGGLWTSSYAWSWLSSALFS